MESDYFPRLSAVNSDKEKINSLVNSQAEVAILLMAPLIVGFIVFLAVIVSLLLTSRFSDAVPMARIAAVGLAFKAMTQPLSYVSLAKGDSRTFMLQEVLYDVVFVLTVLLFFHFWGITMTGTALTVAAMFDMAMVCLITRVRYGVTLSHRAMTVFSVQLPVIAVSWITSSFLDGVWRLVAGIILLFISSAYSFHFLKKHTSFIRFISEKIRNKIGL